MPRGIPNSRSLDLEAKYAEYRRDIDELRDNAELTDEERKAKMAERDRRMQADEYEARVGMYHPSKRYEISVALSKDMEPVKIFAGANGRDFLIERGKRVVVPGPVLEVLDNAIQGVTEEDPDDHTKTFTVDRQRFGYTIHAEL